MKWTKNEIEALRRAVEGQGEQHAATVLVAIARHHAARMAGYRAVWQRVEAAHEVYGESAPAMIDHFKQCESDAASEVRRYRRLGAKVKAHGLPPALTSRAPSGTATGRPHS